MQNSVSEGRTLTIPVPKAVASGELVAIGGIVGFAVKDAAANARVAVTTEGVFTAPKRADNAEAFALGDVLYVDADGAAGGGAAFSKVAAGNGEPAGVAVEPATGDATVCTVKLRGVRA